MRLWERGEKLPSAFSNEDDSEDRAMNAFLPEEITQDIQDMQDDFWRRNGFDSYEESSGERQEAHWDAHVPDPDTGEWAMPRGYDFREMSMSSYQNQTAVQTYLRLEREHGANGSATVEWLHRHAAETFERAMEEAHAPDGGWPSDLEPSTSELLWCQEPLEALDAWSRNDTTDYYARAEGWQDWSEATMEAWMEERKRKDAEYSRLELEAFNEYARRRGKPPGHPSLSPGEPTSRAPARPSPAGPRASGYRGVAKPVHQANATDGTQVWDEYLSEDGDPERHPEYPWNREPTEEELGRQGGPMRDLTPEQLQALRGSAGKRRKSLGALATEDEEYFDAED